MTLCEMKIVEQTETVAVAGQLVPDVFAFGFNQLYHLPEQLQLRGPCKNRTQPDLHISVMLDAPEGSHSHLRFLTPARFCHQILRVGLG
jgi:hypothetical protein